MGDDTIARNAAAWTGFAATYAVDGRRAWASDDPAWGIWSTPERTLGALPPGGVDGMRVAELGCGTGYWSAWLARRGARPVGVDPTPAQLATARALQREFALPFPLVRGAGEHVPLATGAWDLVLSEYGAAMWADPLRWIPEAARLLRPGGWLAFMTQSPFIVCCLPDEGPAGTTLQRPWFGMHRLEWPEDQGAVQFNLTTGDWIRLLRRHGLSVENLIEVQPPEGATAGRYDFVTLAWARQWPSEQVWVARRA
jgi:SAM-dependent methyltransferase